MKRLAHHKHPAGLGMIELCILFGVALALATILFAMLAPYLSQPGV